MLPLRDVNPSRTFPLLTFFIIGLNVWFFWENYQSSEAFAEALLEYGYIPAEPFSIERVLTSMFMHGSWAHLLFNMWALWVFGDNVEDALGKVGYLVLYLTSGLGALVTHVVLYSHSEVPVVGASGAISGVMGAYLVLFPHAKIWTYVPPFYFTRLSAQFFLIMWFVLQLVQGILDKFADIFLGAAGGIAFAAHVGGFVVGWVLALLMRSGKGDREGPFDYLS
ncbi:MAG: rhomboid family intramembrane serine protease [Bacteroidia bacterium]|nr:rhomboid family intramembrane serine protease [Bacteroidia bacterium]MCX7764184.1 rhomboid family intramembrane serine protease [Bacteroidia bacterium]MDW8057238.1 rhomboid family intramembrane serine protease [Bacteroidia bacterium]